MLMFYPTFLILYGFVVHFATTWHCLCQPGSFHPHFWRSLLQLNKRCPMTFKKSPVSEIASSGFTCTYHKWLIMQLVFWNCFSLFVLNWICYSFVVAFLSVVLFFCFLFTDCILCLSNLNLQLCFSSLLLCSYRCLNCFSWDFAK